MDCVCWHPCAPSSLVSAAKAPGRLRGAAGADHSSVIPASKLAAALRFAAIFVDEAAQCTEAEVLTPLRLAFAGHVLPVAPAAEHSSFLGIPVHVEGSGSGGWVTVSPWSTRSACVRLVLVGDPLQVRPVAVPRVQRLPSFLPTLFSPRDRAPCAAPCDSVVFFSSPGRSGRLAL